MTRFVTLLVAALAVTGCTAAASNEASSASADTSGANLIALTGTYQSHGEADAMDRLTVDVVDTRMTGSADRLAGLEAAGAACTAVFSTTYRCTSLSKDVPQSSLDKIAKANTFRVTFKKPTAPPSLTSQADSLTEYLVSQPGESSVGRFDSYRYLELDGGLVKIVLQDGANNGAGTELIVEDAKHLAKYGSTTVSDGQWRFFQDSALVVLH